MSGIPNLVKTKILELLKNKPLTTKVLYDQITLEDKPKKRMFSRHLQELVEQGKIEKIGGVRSTYFRLIVRATIEDNFVVDKDVRDYINENYSYITPTGEFLFGMEGLVKFHEKQNEKFESFAKEYYEVSNRYKSFKVNGFVNITDKVKSSHENFYLKQILANDFYSLPKFGKSKLANLVYLAKQSQNVEIMQEIVKLIRNDVLEIIKKHQIDAILIVPPTVIRGLQLMYFIGSNLDIDIPILNVSKTGLYRISQKTLKSFKERVENARASFEIDNNQTHYKNVLIIDDACGSGSTINEIAKKLVDSEIAKNVFAYALVASYKGFDVINEV